jgi:hypothetical protein
MRHMTRERGTAAWDDVFAGEVASHAPVAEIVFVNRMLEHHKQLNATAINRTRAVVDLLSHTREVVGTGSESRMRPKQKWRYNIKHARERLHTKPVRGRQVLRARRQSRQATERAWELGGHPPAHRILLRVDALGPCQHTC